MKRSLILGLATLLVCLLVLSSNPQPASADADYHGLVVTTSHVYSFTVNQGVVTNTAVGSVQYTAGQHQSSGRAFAEGILTNLNAPTYNQDFVQGYFPHTLNRVYSGVVTPTNFVDAKGFTTVGPDGKPGAIMTIAGNQFQRFYLWNEGIYSAPQQVNLGPNQLISVGHNGTDLYYVRREDSIEIWQGSLTNPSPIFNVGAYQCDDVANIELIDNGAIGEYCNGIVQYSDNPPGVTFMATPPGMYLNGVATNGHYLIGVSYTTGMKFYNTSGVNVANSPQGVYAEGGAIGIVDQFVGYCQDGVFKVVDPQDWNHVWGSFAVSGGCVKVQMEEQLQIGPDPEVHGATAITNTPVLQTLTAFANTSQYTEHIEVQLTATAENGPDPVPNIPTGCFMAMPNSVICEGNFDPGPTTQQTITWSGGNAGENVLIAVHLCAQQGTLEYCEEHTVSSTIPSTNQVRIYLPLMLK